MTARLVSLFSRAASEALIAGRNIAVAIPVAIAFFANSRRLVTEHLPFVASAQASCQRFSNGTERPLLAQSGQMGRQGRMAALRGKRTFVRSRSGAPEGDKS